MQIRTKTLYITIIMVAFIAIGRSKAQPINLVPDTMINLSPCIKEVSTANSENTLFGQKFSSVNGTGQGVTFNQGYADSVSLSALDSLVKKEKCNDSEMVGLRIHYGLKPTNYMPVLIYELIKLKYSGLTTKGFSFYVTDSQKYFLYNRSTSIFSSVSDISAMTNLYSTAMRVKDANGNMQTLKNGSDPNTITFPWVEINALKHNNMDTSPTGVSSHTITGIIFSYAARLSNDTNLSYYIQAINIMPILNGGSVLMKQQYFTGKAADMGALCPPNCPPATITFSK